jgi:hypothetical protein
MKPADQGQLPEQFVQREKIERAKHPLTPLDPVVLIDGPLIEYQEYIEIEVPMIQQSVSEAINVDPRNKRRTWFEDICIKVDDEVAYFSVLVDHELWADGTPKVTRIEYQGKPITMLPVLVELIELQLQAEQFVPEEA